MNIFTVIICSYNREAIVGNAIDAVLGQSFDDFELIVVNDGSTDNTQTVLDSVEDPRFRSVTRPNGGLSAARNTGLGSATGDWVIFLDDDDHPFDNWLEVLQKLIADDVGMLTCGCQYVDDSGRLLETRTPTPHPLFPEVLGVFMPGTFAVRREVYNAVSGYAESIPVSHQTEVVLRLLPELQRRGLSCASVDDGLLAIERRPPKDRPLSQPKDLLVGAEYLIEHHGSHLASVPKVLADYHSVAGVSAAQINEFDRSRQHLLEAARLGGWAPKRALRLMLASVPPLARRVWGRHLEPAA